MVVRDGSLKDTISRYLEDRLASTPNVHVLANSEITALDGDDVLRKITVANRLTGSQREFATRWLFVCIGGMPNTVWAEEVGIARDDAGYLKTGPDLDRTLGKWPLDRGPYYLETSMPGVFAAGDVRHGSVKRCASAVGEGAMAVTFVHRYLASG
jgi:thioredoxin reductase (NADPH)